MRNENLENQSLSNEELSLFLKKIGVTDEREEKAATMDHLSGDVLEKTAISPINPLNLESEERSKRSLFPLWLSLSILLTFFIGSVFGFFWGHSKPQSQNEIFPEKQTEIVLLLKEVKKLCLKILEIQNGTTEILEPIPTPSEMERLAPKSLS